MKMHPVKSVALGLLTSALLVGAMAQQVSAQAQPGPVVGPTDPVVGPVERPAPLDPARAARLTERLGFLLSGYEYFPDRATLDKEGSAAEVVAVLLAMSADGKQRPAIRVKAIDALGYYDEAAGVARLRVLAMSAPSDKLPVAELRLADSMRHHAIAALARALGERAVGELKLLLGDGDLQIQLTAVSALGKYGGAAGRAALVELSESTTHPILMREIKKHIP